MLRLQGSDTFTETVPMLDAQGHMTPQEVERELLVDVAVRWDTGYDSEMRSFVNVIATPKGGTHVSGYEAALTRTFNDAMRATKALKVNDDDVIKDDILEGMTSVVDGPARGAAVRGADQGDPRYAGGARRRAQGGRRGAGEVPDLDQADREGRGQAADGEGRGCGQDPGDAAPDQGDPAAEERAGVLGAAVQLADCRATDNDRTELFIVEGDSALGTAKLARNSEFQALLPIRGKILNVQKASVADMLKNTECASILQVVGAGSGRDFDVEARRYGRIIFMADADSDGAHIRTLLATLFFKYMRDLVEAGRVFSAVPPLHRIELSNPKKGMDKYVYTYSDDELQRKLAELTKKGVRWKDPIQRYKGLGEMDADQPAETTMDPRRRTLRRLTLDDADQAAMVFELLMGSEVARARSSSCRRLRDRRGDPGRMRMPAVADNRCLSPRVTPA